MLKITAKSIVEIDECIRLSHLPDRELLRLQVPIFGLNQLIEKSTFVVLQQLHRLRVLQIAFHKLRGGGDQFFIQRSPTGGIIDMRSG